MKIIDKRETKKKATTTKTEKSKGGGGGGGTEAIVKGWELNDFAAHLR